MSNSNLNLKLVMELLDKVSQPVEKLSSKVTVSLKKATAAAFELGDKMDKAGKKASEIGGFLSARVTAPILALGGVSIRAAGQIEELVEQLTPLAGGADKAAEYVKGLQRYIDRFGVADVSEAVEQLEIAGYSLSEINKRMGLLGDIAAGAKQPIGAMTAQYIAMRKAGKLSDGDLTAMHTARIPIVKELAAQLGKSEKQIWNMAAQGKITFKDYQKALEGLTKEGGRFADGMEKRGGTINGVFQSLSNILTRLAPIGALLWEKLALGDKINGLIDGVESAVKWFIALPDPIKDVIVYAVMLAAAIGPLTLIVGQIITGLGGLLMILSKIPMALGILAGGFKLLLGFGDLLAMGLLKLPKILFAIELAATGLFKVLFMNPIGLIITGIVALGVAAYMLIKHWDKVKTFFADLWDGIKTAFEDGVKGALAFLQPLIDGVEKVIGGIAKIGKRAGDAVKGGMNFVFGGDAPSGPRIGAAASPVGAAPLLSSQNGRIDAGGTLKIEVDDRRVRVAEAKPNDSRMQIRPAATGGIMEVY